MGKESDAAAETSRLKLTTTREGGSRRQYSSAACPSSISTTRKARPSRPLMYCLRSALSSTRRMVESRRSRTSAERTKGSSELVRAGLKAALDASEGLEGLTVCERPAAC